MARGPVAAPRTSQTILVVEDNAPLREVLGILLDYEWFRVAGAADGRQALDWLEQHCPALVILDWLLPRVGGAEVLAASAGAMGPRCPCWCSRR